MVTNTMKVAAKKGEAVRVDGVTYWAGEDLREGMLVEIGADNLVRPVQAIRPNAVQPVTVEIIQCGDEDGIVVRREVPRVPSSFAWDYLAETKKILDVLEYAKIEEMAQHLALARTIYVVGLGGSAATASHAANDLRKLCGKNAICPTDNTSLMTALANDNSFDEWLVDWLELQGPPNRNEEAILFLSVGGGTSRTSHSLVRAAQTCRALEGRIPVLAIVGRDGGEIAKVADCAIVIPNLFPEHVTPHVEGLASVLLHLLVSHPALAKNPPTWRT